jgi:two-component system, NarL family, invasion response regulator UvrY
MKQPRIRVAIADDHVVVANALSEMLNSMGFEVLTQAYDGQHLIAELEKCKILPDVCILDINMPVMNGLDALLVMRQRWPRMRVLVLSLSNNENVIIKMIREGACGYLTKSCSAETLKKAIESIFNVGVYYSEQIGRKFFNFVKDGKITPLHLSPSEWRVLEFSCENTDLTWDQIAVKLGVSKDSIHSTRDNLFKKLGIHSRAGLVKLAIQKGFIPVELEFNDTNFFKTSNFTRIESE